MGRISFERAILGNTAGAFGAGMAGTYNPPPSFLGASIYGASYLAGSVPRYMGGGAIGAAGASAGLVGAAASGPYHAARDFLDWRRSKASEMSRAKYMADEMGKTFQNHSLVNSSWGFGGKEGADFRNLYGRELNNSPVGSWDLKGRIDRAIEGPYKPRRFGARNFSEHMAQGGRNYAKMLTSPTNWGLNIAFAGLMSNDNLMDPKDGFVKNLAESLLGEAGFMGGVAIAPALIAKAIPGSMALAGVGMVVGGFAGALAMTAIPGMVSDYSDWGNANGRRGKPFRSNLINSEQAATMRQRGVQAIYRSQMNARSALGSEALSYHS